MLRARYTLMTLALALFPVGCAPVGCAGEDPEMDESTEQQWAGVTEQKLPTMPPGQQGIYGTWKGDAKHVDFFEILVLMTDGRYHGARTVNCIQAPCPPKGEDGTFKVFARDGRNYLQLTALGTGHTDRYEYGSDGMTLKLRPLRPGSEWYPLPRAGTAWCGGERDCGLQLLPAGPCAGSYVCAENSCNWKCATGTEAAAANPADPSAAAATRPGGIDVSQAGLCPPVGECATAGSACKTNPRDNGACETAKKCDTCYPNGYTPKEVPELQNPRANPVLK